MKRIKYTIEKPFIMAKLQDIYARTIIIQIVQNITKKDDDYVVCIFRRTQQENEKRKVVKFTQKSLQNAKRKVRKILKEEFEVNLGEEVRSVLCI